MEQPPPPQEQCAAAVCVFQHSDLLPAVLAFLPPAAFAAAPAASRAFHTASTAPGVDGVWIALALARWPSCGPMLEALRARGQSTRDFGCGRIVGKGPHFDGEMIGKAKAAELQRLRAFFRDSFLELQLTCHDAGRVLASTLVPLAEEKYLRLLFTAERGFFFLDPHHSLQLPGYALAVTLLHPGDGQERPPLTVCLVSGAGLQLHDHRINIRGNRSIGEYMHVMYSDADLVLPNLAVVHSLTFHASVMSEMVGNEDAASDVKLWLDVSAVRENGTERMYPTELVDMYMLLHACVERQRMLEGLDSTRLGSTMDGT